MNLKSAIYAVLRLHSDLAAIQKGPKAIAKRLQRKAVGRMAGRIMRKI